MLLVTYYNIYEIRKYINKINLNDLLKYCH